MPKITNFDPAPFDKYAQGAKEAIEADMEESRLDEELKETFPASDPLSDTQPKRSSDKSHLDSSN